MKRGPVSRFRTLRYQLVAFLAFLQKRFDVVRVKNRFEDFDASETRNLRRCTFGNSCASHQFLRESHVDCLSVSALSRSCSAPLWRLAIFREWNSTIVPA